MCASICCHPAHDVHLAWTRTPLGLAERSLLTDPYPPWPYCARRASCMMPNTASLSMRTS